VRSDGVPGEHVTEAGREVGIVVESEDGVRLGQVLGELGTVPFGQTAHRDDLGTGVRGGEQGVDGVLLGLLDEAAGVHHHQVGLLLVPDQLVAAIGQPSCQFFGVDLVACASHGEQGDTCGRPRQVRDGGSRC